MRENNFRKRQILATLLLVSLLLGATSCTTNKKETSKETSTKTATNTQSEPEIPEFSSEATIEETILVDANNVKVTATGLNYTERAVEVNLLIENNSDRTLSFITGSVGYNWNAVNNYMLSSSYLNADVTSGNKATESIRIDINELQLYGIKEIADIQIGFDIEDEDFNEVYRGVGKITTSAAANQDYQASTYQETISSGLTKAIYSYSLDHFSDKELYNQGDISISSEALVTNKDGEKAFLIEVKNNGSEPVYAKFSDIAINGLVSYSGLWTSQALLPGCSRIFDLSTSSILEPALGEKCGIKEIGSFEFCFTVTDNDGTERLAPNFVTITPNKKLNFDETGTEVYNKGNIRFISKGLLAPIDDYDSYFHLVLIVQNTSKESIKIREVYDSLAINGYMADCIVSTLTLTSDKSALLDIQINDDFLSENGLESIDDIVDAEISFEITDEASRDETEAKLKFDF